MVIATHSIEILKWLEAHIKQNPQDESFVAHNQFPINDPPFLDQCENYDFETILSNIITYEFQQCVRVSNVRELSASDLTNCSSQ